MIRETRITWQRIVELSEAILDLQADADEQGAEGLEQEERRKCRERLRRERSRHLLQELKHGALRVLGCCDGEVDAVLARA